MQQDLPQCFAPFIRAVFFSLELEGIPYVVLRNYDALPVDPGHDIDILIKPEFLSTIATVLERSAERSGWRLIQTSKRYGFQSFIFVSTDEVGDHRSLKWDIWGPISWKGLTWIDTDMVMETRRRDSRGFYIPAPGIEAATLLLKELLQVGLLNRQYTTRICSLVHEDPTTFKITLKRFYGEKLAESIYVDVKGEDWDAIEKESMHLRRCLLIKSLQRHPVKSILNIMLFVKGHVIDFVRGRNSVFICFIGPDGSGKSTMSSHVMERLQDLFEDIRYFHGHYGVMPEISKIVPSLQNRSEGQSNPIIAGYNLSNNGLHGTLKQTLLMSYYTLDYILGYILIMSSRNRSKLIVFDRYFYDYVIQPSSITINSWTYRILSFFLPCPDLIVYLKSPAEVIRARKQELTVAEIARQAGICDMIVAMAPNGYCVDNTKPLEDGVSKVRGAIIDRIFDKQNRTVEK